MVRVVFARLKQFKQEMGLEGPSETGGGDKTIGKKIGVQ